MSPERVSVAGEKEGRSMLMDRKQKRRGTSRGESGARNLEAESIRSRAENTEGCAQLTTVTEIRRSSARDTVITESVYLVLNSFLDWKPGEKLKQRCYGVSLTFFQHEANSAALYATKAMDRGIRQARKDRTLPPNFAEGSFNPTATLCRGQL